MAGEKGEQQPPGQGNERVRRPSYLDARRYPSAEEAARAYHESQESIRRDRHAADLSVYRLMIGPTLESHVVILGDTPNKRLRAQLLAALSSGEPVDLDYEVLDHLMQRRRSPKEPVPGLKVTIGLVVRFICPNDITKSNPIPTMTTSTCHSIKIAAR